VNSYNASKWQMGFNSAFKGLNTLKFVHKTYLSYNGLFYSDMVTTDVGTCGVPKCGGDWLTSDEHTLCM